MKNLFRPLVLLAALMTLAGCGLKGPLYFPPADKSAAPPTKPVNTDTQTTEPSRNDRGDNGGPTQVNY
ncbi:LPS translocon maturation chaperone LptM [Scandinavium manionii]|uniref:LPS translocon maturation chaperone LptM n=1 Tax=Scandinavium manionii TaxID=2926520 RepID=UPI0013589AD0|nr:lipoprotein [Scandinavium manionii]MCS2146976.1 lipoprotein [Scandinavium manionii]MCS2164272.1 lipoprotein [Scandinavium manionii]